MTNTFVKSDSAGNQIIIIVHTEDDEKVSAEIYLRLRNSPRRRKLGIFHYKTKVFQVKRTPTSHFHYAANGYGFNDEVLREEQMFNIEVIDLKEKDGDRYIFPKSVLLNYGRYLHFKSEGYERQRFININLLKPFKQEKHVKEQTSKNGLQQKGKNESTNRGWRADS